MPTLLLRCCSCLTTALIKNLSLSTILRISNSMTAITSARLFTRWVAPQSNVLTLRLLSYLTPCAIHRSHRLNNLPPIAHSPQRRNCTTTPPSQHGTMSGEWSEHEFAALADSSLESISEAVSSVGYDLPSTSDDFDVDLSQGVLTINLGSDMGTYVLNTQTPNRQIWMSSPISGPWRYAWHPTRHEWISTRDSHSLSQRLSEEFTQALKHPIHIKFEQ